MISQDTQLITATIQRHYIKLIEKTTRKATSAQENQHGLLLAMTLKPKKLYSQKKMNKRNTLIIILLALHSFGQASHKNSVLVVNVAQKRIKHEPQAPSPSKRMRKKPNLFIDIAQPNTLEVAMPYESPKTSWADSLLTLVVRFVEDICPAKKTPDSHLPKYKKFEAFSRWSIYYATLHTQEEARKKKMHKH